MKKTWISLLIALLMAAVSVNGAVAAVNAVELDIESPDIESLDTVVNVESGMESSWKAARDCSSIPRFRRSGASTWRLIPLRTV